MSMQGSALRGTEIALWCSTAGIILFLTCSILTAPWTAEAQQATKVHRIGVLLSGLPPSDNHLLEAFRQGLHDLGYAEGQNLVIEARYAEGSLDRYRDLAAEFVRLQVDVIIAGGRPAIRAAQHATRTIPIVMAGTLIRWRKGSSSAWHARGGTSRA